MGKNVYCVGHSSLGRALVILQPKPLPHSTRTLGQLQAGHDYDQSIFLEPGINATAKPWFPGPVLVSSLGLSSGKQQIARIVYSFIIQGFKNWLFIEDVTRVNCVKWDPDPCTWALYNVSRPGAGREKRRYRAVNLSLTVEQDRKEHLSVCLRMSLFLCVSVSHVCACVCVCVCVCTQNVLGFLIHSPP